MFSVRVWLCEIGLHTSESEQACCLVQLQYKYWVSVAYYSNKSGYLCLLFQHNSLMLLSADYSQNYASIIICQGLYIMTSIIMEYKARQKSQVLNPSYQYSIFDLNSRLSISQFAIIDLSYRFSISQFSIIDPSQLAIIVLDLTYRCSIFDPNS